MTRAELGLVLDEITPAITGGAVQKVFEADRNTVVLRIRARGETQHLLASTRPGFTRAHLVEDKPQQPPHPTAFTMQLRKWVEGSRITEVRLLEGDRIMVLEADAPNPEETEPSRVKVRLVFELTGQHGNAYLLDEENLILGQAHRYRGVTEVEPGDLWVRPPNPPEMSDSQRWDLDERPPGTRSELVEQQFEAMIAEHERDEKKQSLTAALKSHHKRLKRRLKAVEGDLERAEGASAHKRRADLLQGAYGQEISRGSTSIEVTDYYDPELRTVELELDPKISLQENIDRAFHEYRRLSEATDRIEARLLETMELIEQVEEARVRLRELELLYELAAFEDEIRGTGLLPRRRNSKGSRGGSEERRPYRSYEASSGAEILVGRNARANDQLTSKYARGRDIWLHARDWPGSHVVLRMRKNDEPRGDDLLDAALLAAHFSRGSDDSLVDVTWTLAKHVRKPKGAAAGLVTHSGGSNIAVRHDPKRLARLLASMKE